MRSAIAKVSSACDHNDACHQVLSCQSSPGAELSIARGKWAFGLAAWLVYPEGVAR
jgi:hypothetical protein